MDLENHMNIDGVVRGALNVYKANKSLPISIPVKQKCLQLIELQALASLVCSPYGRAETIPTLLYSYQNQTRLNYN